MNNSKGFTLIEVVVALAIFAVLASITSYILFHSFSSDEHIKVQAARLREIDFAMTWLRRDTEQLLGRPVRGEQQKLIAAFVGQEHYIEFTRNGYGNIDAIEPRSTLKRVAYLCQGSHLIRRSWSVLDSSNRNNYHDTVLLTRVQLCSFGFTNRQHKTTFDWIVTHSDADKKQFHSKIPIAILAHFILADWGEITMAIPIAVGFYD